jgi:DNA-binding NtrC family response regulator
MSILIVDDDCQVTNSLKSYLEHSGYQVKIAHNIEHGLQEFHAADGEIDLVLCDFQMPQGNGTELFGAIEGDSPMTPFIFMTAEADLLRTNNDFGAQCKGILNKPFRMSRALEFIQRHI